MTYYELHKEKWIEYARNSKRTPEQKLLASAKHRAKQKGLDFNLDLSDITIPERCPISNLILVRGSVRPSDFSPSIDRIDNSQGYVKGNVRIISQRINRRKSDLSLEEIKRLYQYSKGEI